MYGVFAANSAAQVSIRLNTGRTFSRCRSARTSSSVTPPVIATTASWISPEPRAIPRDMPRRFADCSASHARRLSEKPIDFSRRIPAASIGRPSFITSASAATISAIRSRNHGSYFAIAWTSATVMPSRNACAATSSRSGVGTASAASISARGAPTSRST